MPTIITIDGVTLTLKKYPEFAAGNPTATDITLFSDPVNGDLFKTTMDNFIANVLNVDGVTITGDGSSGNPLVGSGISGITADNGLTASTGTNVQLGGTLTKNTTIATGAFGLTISTATAAVVPLVVTATTGIGVSAQVTSGVGITGYASTGIGVQGSSDGGTYGGKFQTYNASTNNTVNPVLQLLGLNGNAPSANGFGIKADFELMTTDFGTTAIANSISSKWTDATHATRTSQLDITGVNSAATGTIASFYGSGVVGIGISSSYTATRLNVVDNSLAGATMVDITSSNTGATGNLQKVINVNLSGANATNSQTTYGIFGQNSHSGTGNVNYGVFGQTSNEFAGAGVGGSSVNAVGVSGSSTNNHGVLGSSTNSGDGGHFTSGSGIGVSGLSTSGLAGDMQVNPSSTNTVVTVMKIRRLTSGTAAAGLGGSIVFEGEVSSGAIGNMGSIEYSYTTATAAAETSTLTLKNYLAGSSVSSLVLAGDGSVKLRPITATAASAITPAEGMLVFVSNTDATFTTIGFWGYANGAWAAF